MRSFLFQKDIDSRWFAVIPEWEGERDELEMVMGADTMLDIISQGQDEVRLTLSTEPFEGYDYILTLKEEIYEGGTYDLKGRYVSFDIWLCHVTKFVFGEMPTVIYAK
jgi:hypothetical protein